MNMANYKIIHCINQFFAGLGGEEQADLAPTLINGTKGPGLLLEKLCPEIKISATIIFGDNYVASSPEKSAAEIIKLLEPRFKGAEAPSLLLAGPAFNAGRYGLACGAICKAVAEYFQIPAITAMHPANPGADQYKKDIYIAEAAENVMGMQEALERMAALGLKLERGEEVSPESDKYIPQGKRKNVFANEPGAKRVVDMLLKKIRGESFATEYAMPVFDRVEPAPAIVDTTKARLALVTSGGIVPKGNPDKIEAANAQKFGKYSIKGLSAFNAQSHQTAHGGYDPTFANLDPNRVLPLDAVQELVAQGAIGSLHDYYYATVGNATSVANGKKFGGEIAKQLVADGVQAVILTST
jgi:glycine reductase